MESRTTFRDSLTSQMLLPLPEWPAKISKHYLDSCIELFTNELQNAQYERSPSIMTAYAYLRGCAYLARGCLLEGLRDLYSINNQYLFPRHYIETIIVPRLSEQNLLELFLYESFYLNCPEWKKVRTNVMTQRMSIIDLEESGNLLDDTTPVKSTTDMTLDNSWHIVDNSVTFQRFSECVNRLSIILDKETAETLFNALLYWTYDKSTKIQDNEKALVNGIDKSSETKKSITRRWSITSNTATLNTFNGYRQGNQNVTGSTQLSTATLPGDLFESFLDIWQQTNAEKIRMNRYLPEKRQKKESVLKVKLSYI